MSIVNLYDFRIDTGSSTNIIYTNASTSGVAIFTDNISEGSSNLYYTNSRVDSRISINSNVISGNTAYSWGNHSTAGYVSLTGIQTLTNKTLSSPVINVSSDATGDIYYRNSGGAFTRLGIGSTNQILQVSAGLPSWQTFSGGSIGGSIATTEIAYGTGTNTIGSNSNFYYDSVNNAITLGGTPLANSKFHTDDTLNDYLQLNIKNLSNGINASSDIVATADSGDDTTNYIDLGINSSGYSAVGFNITTALDGYLYINGGNLAIGTSTANKDIIFHSGGTTTSDRSMVIKGSSGSDKGYIGFLEGSSSNPTLLGKIHIMNEDDNKGTFFADRYTSTANSAALTLRRARGTYNTPTAVQSGDSLGLLAFRGYGATSFSSGSRVNIIARTIQNWTDVAQGTSLEFSTTPSGSVTTAISMSIQNTGITTASTTFSVFNTTTTSITAFQAATTISMGATTGTLTMRNPTIVGTQTGQTLWNTVATSIIAFGAATTITLCATTATSTHNISSGATISGATKTLNIGTSGVSNSTTNINIGSSVSGALGTATINGNTIITQNVKTTGSPIAFTINGGANTTLTASTESSDINFNLARTVQFSTGALTTQRAVVFRAPTYSFVGASTITNSATVSITGAPIASTNATITSSMALWVESGAVKLGSGVALASSAILQVDTTSQGILPPRMTSSQKTSIATPVDGLTVYDTDLKALCSYNTTATAWQTYSVGGLTAIRASKATTAPDSGTITAWSSNTDYIYTITATGATTSMNVIANLDNAGTANIATAGVEVFSWISASNTVKVRIRTTSFITVAGNITITAI